MIDPKGSIVIDEAIAPIVDIYLDRGRFWLVAAFTGPARAFSSQSYTLHDRSGAVVYHSPGLPERQFGCGVLAAGEECRITVSLSIDAVAPIAGAGTV